MQPNDASESQLLSYIDHVQVRVCVSMCAHVHVRWYFLTSVPSHSCRNETCHQGFPIDLQFGLSAKDTDCKAGQGKNILISKSAARGKEPE